MPDGPTSPVTTAGINWQRSRRWPMEGSSFNIEKDLVFMRLWIHINVQIKPFFFKLECRHGKFGLNCGLISRCSTDHTESYDTVTDSFCGCYKNWTGQSCEYDFNECYSTTCPIGQYCYNTYGGYECYCDRHQGYMEADANTCKHIGMYRSYTTYRSNYWCVGLLPFF